MLKFFLLGAVGYPVLELLYRRRTHYSMAIAGGISASAIGAMQKLPFSLTFRSLLSAMCITGIEYAVGRIWNRTYRVWDYRKLPCNYKGQICLPFFCCMGHAQPCLHFFSGSFENLQDIKSSLPPLSAA